MNGDYQRHKDGVRELLAVWEKNKVQLTKGSQSSEIELLLNSTLHIFEILYATKYNIWLFDKYRNWPGDLPQEELAHVILEILPSLNKVKEETQQIWGRSSTEIQNRLSRKEWKSYFEHLQSNFGSAKYAVDLD
jgi:hypothetical protein